jgi:Tfp pilus assembly protein PilF
VKGEIAKANLAMCNAVALHPETPALEGLAMIYLTQNAPTQALVWIEKAEAIRPNVRETMTLHADILSFLGKPDEALALWLSALNIPADDLSRRRGIAAEDATLGRSFMRQGDLPRAERLLRRSVALDPTHAVAAASLAEVMKKRGHSAGAAYFAAKSLELFPMNPDCELILGDLSLEAGDRAQAKLHYAKALSIRSDFWAAKVKLKELDALP